MSENLLFRLYTSFCIMIDTLIPYAKAFRRNRGKQYFVVTQPMNKGNKMILRESFTLPQALFFPIQLQHVTEENNTIDEHWKKISQVTTKAQIRYWVQKSMIEKNGFKIEVALPLNKKGK